MLSFLTLVVLLVLGANISSTPSGCIAMVLYLLNPFPNHPSPASRSRVLRCMFYLFLSAFASDDDDEERVLKVGGLPAGCFVGSDDDSEVLFSSPFFDPDDVCFALASLFLFGCLSIPLAMCRRRPFLLHYFSPACWVSIPWDVSRDDRLVLATTCSSLDSQTHPLSVVSTVFSEGSRKFLAFGFALVAWFVVPGAELGGMVVVCGSDSSFSSWLAPLWALLFVFYIGFWHVCLDPSPSVGLSLGLVHLSFLSNHFWVRYILCLSSIYVSP